MNDTLARQLENFRRNHPIPGEQPSAARLPVYDGRRSTLEGRLSPNAARDALAGFRIRADETGLLRLIPSSELRNA